MNHKKFQKQNVSRLFNHSNSLIYHSFNLTKKKNSFIFFLLPKLRYAHGDHGDRLANITSGLVREKIKLHNAQAERSVSGSESGQEKEREKPHRMFYSADIGLLHIIHLDLSPYFEHFENCITYDECGFPREFIRDSHSKDPSSRYDFQSYRQRLLAFTREDLAAVNRLTTPWVIISSHYPLYETTTTYFDPALGPEERYRPGSSRGRSYRPESNIRPDRTQVIQDLEPLFEEFEIDVYFCGHNHNYETTWPVSGGKIIQKGFYNPKAPVHILSGAAGPPKFDDFHFPNDAGSDETHDPNLVLPQWSREPRLKITSYSRFILYNSTHLNFEQIANEDGRILDTFTIIQDTRATHDIHAGHQEDPQPPPLTPDAPSTFHGRAMKDIPRSQSSDSSAREPARSMAYSEDGKKVANSQPPHMTPRNPSQIEINTKSYLDSDSDPERPASQSSGANHINKKTFKLSTSNHHELRPSKSFFLTTPSTQSGMEQPNFKEKNRLGDGGSTYTSNEQNEQNEEAEGDEEEKREQQQRLSDGTGVRGGDSHDDNDNLNNEPPALTFYHHHDHDNSNSNSNSNKMNSKSHDSTSSSSSSNENKLAGSGVDKKRISESESTVTGIPTPTPQRKNHKVPGFL